LTGHFVQKATLPLELKPSELRKIEFSPGTTIDFGDIAEGTQQVANKVLMSGD